MNARKSEFKSNGLEAGFTEEQLEFMWDYLAKIPHTHDVEEITGLDEYLNAAEDEEEE